MTTTCDLGECRAMIPSDLGDRGHCPNPSVTTRGDKPVCGTHSRQYDRWLSSSEGTARIRARHYWGWE